MSKTEVLLKLKHIFLALNKVQVKLKIFFITFKCLHYQPFFSESPHRRHHLHLPQSLVPA